MKNTHWLRALTLMAVIVFGLVSLASDTLDAQDNPLLWESHITYDTTVDDDSILVTAEMTVTANKPSTRSGYRITSWFFDQIWVPIPRTAENLVATSRGRDLEITFEEYEDEQPDHYLAVLHFARNLFYKKSDDIVLTFTIPGEPARSDNLGRVNAAFKNFLVLAWGDPGTTSVDVIFPLDFEVSAEGEEHSTRLSEGTRVLSSVDIDNPFEFFWWVTARNDDGLSLAQIVVPDALIRVRSWPGDAEWQDDVTEAVREGLPVLQDIIGIQWTAGDSIEILESIEPNLLGYGGWYLEGEDKIEIGEFVDPQLVLHELSHAWFNDALFQERWIIEGLANEFAAAAVESMDLSPGAIDREFPIRASVDGKRSLALNDWGPPEFLDDPEEERREEWGYNASWWVIRRLVDEVGMDEMREILQAIDTNLIAYRSTDAPESVADEDDWRRLLDLAEELGGSEDFEENIRKYVATDDQLVTLDDRVTAREAYAALLAVSDGWQVPYPIREAMENWEFDAAETEMAEATKVIEYRDMFEATEDELGFEIDDDAREIYEDEEDYDKTIDHMADRIDAMNVLVDTAAVAAAERDFLTTLGLWDEKDPMDEQAEAVVLLEGNDPDGARKASADVADSLTAAAARGRWRWNLALGAAIAAWIVGSLIVAGILKIIKHLWRRLRARRAIPA